MTKIVFQKTCQLMVTESFDEELDAPTEDVEIFRKGEEVDVDLIEGDNETLDLQFSNGNVAFGVSKESFKII